MIGNVIQSVLQPLVQNEMGKNNAEWQWNRFYSPKAQVSNLAEAGINPAVAFGNQSPVMTTGGQMTMPDVPALGIGTTALAEIGQYINAKATAAKTERETGKVDAETKKLLSELDAQNLQNDLVRQFGNQKWTFDVAQAYENVLLARKTNDIKEQEKAINEYHKTTSFIESQLKGSELKAFNKRLSNLDTEIKLENKLQSERINTEKSQQTSNYASAKASSAQADLTSSQKKYQDIVNDIKDSGKTFELENLIRSYQAENRVNDASAEQAFTMLERYRQLNENDKNAAAKYLNYMFWFF